MGQNLGIRDVNPAEVRVVVLGAGYGGCACALHLKRLRQSFAVKLVERGECFFHKIGGGKAAVVAGYEERVGIPLNRLSAIEVLWAEATSLDYEERQLQVRHIPSNEVTLLTFDFLAIAVGQGHGWGYLPDRAMSRAEMLAHLREEQARVQDAKRITIFGGGALGIETAAQIRESYPEKPVALKHSNSELMSSAQRSAQGPLSSVFLERLQHKLVTSFEVDIELNVPRDVKTSLRPSEEELVISATGTGTRPSTCKLFPEAWFDPQTWELDVEPTLHVRGAPPFIFAIGDIAKTGDYKQARWAMAHADVVARNLLSLSSGTNATLAEYGPARPEWGLHAATHAVPPQLLRWIFAPWAYQAVPDSRQVLGLWLGENDGLVEWNGVVWNERANRQFLLPKDKGAAGMAKYLNVSSWDGTQA